eukprot:scaffold152802_cov35-Attheya_sp.AAC.1
MSYLGVICGWNYSAAKRSLAGKLAAEDEASHVDVETGVVIEPASKVRRLLGCTARTWGELVGIALASWRLGFFGALVGGRR